MNSSADRPPRHNAPAESRQWADWMSSKVSELLGRERQKQSIDNANNRRSNTNSGLLSEQVAAVPRVESYFRSVGGFGLTTGWSTRVTLTLTMPEDRKTATINVNGYAQVLDMTSGGLAVARARIGVNGTYSNDVTAAKDAGASVVTNLLYPSWVSSFTSLQVLPGATFDIVLDLFPTNAAAFPTNASNLATLTVLAIYT